MSPPTLCRAVQDPRIPSQDVGEITRKASECGIRRFVVNGCWQDDWETVSSLSRDYPGVILPQFGLHPYWVGRRSSDWLERLTQMLVSNPSAGLGECGLDRGPKAPKDVSYEEQIVVFEAQLKLAQELKRPVTVHCVKAFGAVYDCLQKLHISVPVVLHAWTGAREMTITFKTLPNVFFSLNGYLTKLPPTRAIDMLRVLPPERCMLESDAPDGKHSLSLAWKEALPAFYHEFRDQILDQPTGYNTPRAILCTLALVSAATGRSEAEVAAMARDATETAFALYKC